MKQKRILLLGVTGLVGGFVLNHLLNKVNDSKIIAPTRKKLNLTHLNLENIIINFDQITGKEEFFQADLCFCCLGTTIKKAGSQVKFKKIDHDLVVQLAQFCFQQGCQNFAIISSIGANPLSSNFYLKTKGEMEQSLRKVGFKNLKILNQSLIIGDRSESRPLEGLGQKLIPLFSPLMQGPWKKYRPIRADQLATQLVQSLLP